MTNPVSMPYQINTSTVDITNDARLMQITSSNHELAIQEYLPSSHDKTLFHSQIIITHYQYPEDEGNYFFLKRLLGIVFFF
jgi:hypothetical protein